MCLFFFNYQPRMFLFCSYLLHFEVTFSTLLAQNFAEFGSCRLFYAKQLRECPNFLIYTMDIHVLAEFQLKITKF